MKNWSILLVSVLLACFVWLIHVLSLDYSAYLQYRVKVVTELEGFSPSAVAEEALLVRGKAAGFYIMSVRGFHGEPKEISLELDASSLAPIKGQDGVYTVQVLDIRERLVEAFGEHISVDYFDTEALTFKFVRQNFRKVPVTAVTDLSFKDQYMQVGEMTLSPDSVLVYGPASEVDAITEVKTLPIVRYGLQGPAQGYVQFEELRGMRISTERTRYSINVARYVEMSKAMPVTLLNAPRGRSVMMLPSEVTLTCRIAFGQQSESTFDALSLRIDYHDVASSLHAKVIPTVKGLSDDVYTYSLSPAVVECVLVEKK